MMEGCDRQWTQSRRGTARALVGSGVSHWKVAFSESRGGRNMIFERNSQAVG